MQWKCSRWCQLKRYVDISVVVRNVKHKFNNPNANASFSLKQHTAHTFVYFYNIRYYERSSIFYKSICHSIYRM